MRLTGRALLIRDRKVAPGRLPRFLGGCNAVPITALASRYLTGTEAEEERGREEEIR